MAARRAVPSLGTCVRAFMSVSPPASCPSTVYTSSPSASAPLYQFVRSFAAASSDLKTTALHDFHVANGGKMVPFAGYNMPIQYKDSIMDSTLHCRSHGSIFDVSHMCGLSLKGKDSVAFLETLVVGDVAGLKPGCGTLSLFTNEQGGIIDDTVVTKVDEQHVYLVVNAGCREKDLEHLGRHLEPFRASGRDVSMHVHDERSLLALQGPLAAPSLQKLTQTDLSRMYFSDFMITSIDGVECFLTRTGYTGEDGFEISIPNDHAVRLTQRLLEVSQAVDQPPPGAATAGQGVRLAGLGARDSLRLEAGLCLYGNDIDDKVGPVEAGLTWTIGKRRRTEGGFLGAEKVLAELAAGPTKRRVGLTSTGAPARSHTEIVGPDGGLPIGEVTSGGFSPCLKKNIAMGYVANGMHKAGTKVQVNVRGKLNDAVVVKMPFVPTKYYKPSA